MIAFVLYLWLYLGLIYTIGLPVALWLYARSDKEMDLAVSVAAFGLGFFLLNLAVYWVSVLTGAGTSIVARPTLAAVLTTAAAALLRSAEMRARLATFARRQGRQLPFLLLVVFPLASTFILWPMLVHGWQYAYSVSNDGATYVLMVEYLQDHIWTLGERASSTLGFSYIGRPMLHYSMAAILSLSWLTPYQSYSMAAAVVCGLAALALAQLAWAALGAGQQRTTLAMAALSVGVFAPILTLYYQGSYLPHAFSSAPVLFALYLPWLPAGFARRLAYTLVFLLGAALVYSLGVTVIILAVIGGAVLARLALRQMMLSDAVCLGLAAAAAAGLGLLLVHRTELPFFIGNLGRGFSGDVNHLTWFWMVSLGLENKFVRLIPLDYVGPILLWMLLGWATLTGLRRMRYDAGYLGMLCAIGLLVAAAYALEKHFFLNKLSLYVALLLYASLSAGWSWRRSAGGILLTALPLAVAACLAVTAFLVMQRFFISAALGKGTFITADLLRARQAFFEAHTPRTLLSVENNLERLLHVRHLFGQVRWEPASNEMVWLELQVDPKRPPAWYGSYEYDVVLMGETEKDPVDYTPNEPYLLLDGPGYNIYGSRSSVVDFDLAWGMVRGRPEDSVYFRRLEQPEGSIIFVNADDHLWLKVSLYADVGGEPLEPFPSDRVRASVAGEPVPISADGDLVLEARFLSDRVNRILLTLDDVSGVVVHDVSFGK